MFKYLIILGFMGFNANAKQDLTLIKQAFDNYWNSELVSMDVERINIYPNLGTEDKARGKMYFSKGKLRFDIVDPKPSHLIIGDKIIWYSEKSEFEENKWVVVKVSKDKAKSTQAFFNLLFGDTGVTKKLDLIGNNKIEDKHLESYILKPKSATEFPGITKLAIIFNNKTKQIMYLQYWDSLENQTSYELTNIVKKDKSDKSLFKYTPPKNSDITVY